jgi:uncharacterized circularly permuted ATP-grasp superfamily protein/uncharacterized alpha-E superfamily protein
MTDRGAVEHYDELRGEKGALRPHWQQFFGSLGPGDQGAELVRRERLLQRQVREHGITYNVYGDRGDDGGGLPRRWSLDLLPFILPQEDWRIIEAAVVQRADLLSRILADAYGEQQLLSRGLLPAALIHGSPRYLRPLRGVRPPGGHFLHLVAFDLARSPQGSWWVASQRTQAPSGLGYALENRLIVSEVFPEVFPALRVQRLASSFRLLLDTLARLAPQDADPQDGAGTVLLTPGPLNETYFEHTSLARYLGIPLVVGPDLTVRDERLFLKTLHGLRRVHTVIRRVDDAFCDPLELRADSALGVPGLVQAVRAGHVLVANALGAGLLESHAMHGFLPGICRELLGTELLVPSRDTWWCGETLAREQAFSRLETARVRPTYGGNDDPALDAAREFVALADWRARIEADPDTYTIQTHVPFSKTPGWHEGRIAPRSALVRVYAFVDAAGKWHAMPGGLTRIAQNNSRVSMQRGGSSADTWVITGDEVDSFSMLARGTRRDGAPVHRRAVSSRAAENLFWMGRYTERADNFVRFARQTLFLLRGDEPAPPQVVREMTRLAAIQGLVPGGRDWPSRRSFERTMLSSLGDPAAYSLSFHLSALLQCASGIRERLSVDHWRTMSATAERLAAALAGGGTKEGSRPGPIRAADAQEALQEVAVGIAALIGAQTDGMTRDDGWRLLTLGRQIERLSSISTVVGELVAGPATSLAAGFDFALALCDCTITYRARNQGSREIPALIDLLVRERANPRSLACCAWIIGEELDRLVAATGTDRAFAPWPQGDAPFPESAELGQENSAGELAALREFAGALRSRALQLSEWLGERYFTHSGAVRAFGI